jgi:glycosyltransferase involved in cell wall biosynthesis
MFERYKNTQIAVVGTSFHTAGGDWRSIYLYAQGAGGGGRKVIIVNPLAVRGWRQAGAVLCFSPRVIVNALCSFQSWLVVLMCLLRPEVRVYLHETEYALDAYRRSNPLRYRILCFVIRRNPILCTSRSAEALYRKRFGARNTAVVYECPGDIGEIQLDPDRLHIINVASLEERKGAKLFSEVADLAKERHPDWQFHWVGGFPENEGGPLSAAVERHGFMWQPSEIVKQCRLFFLSSLDDPCPLSALEALHAGVGCVAYAKTGTAELVESIPGCGVFTDYTAQSALAAIEAALAASPADAREIKRAIEPTTTGNFRRSIESSFFPERANQPDRGWTSTEQDVASPNLALPPRIEWPESSSGQAIDGAISAIIPACNRAPLIGQTLRSLLHQTRPAAEIILVDDGSTDGTAETVLEMLKLGNAEKLKISGGKPWPEFKVIRQENAGPGAARNRGFAESRGEFIHFFDSDDLAAPNKHEVQARALQQSGADIAFGPWVKGLISELGAWSGEHGARSGERGAGTKERRYSFEPEGHVLQQKGLPQGDLIKELLTRWTVVPHACMFRRSIVEKIGGFPTELFGSEDQMMFLRCLLNGARVVHTPDTIEFYRQGDPFKITATGAAQQRHAKEWVKFLVSARRECLKIGIDPMKWAGFRRRIWSAEKNLMVFGLASSFEGSEKLPELSSFQRLRSKVASKGQRMRAGLSQRFTGNRQNSSYRCGRLTPAQAALFPTS